MSKKPEIPEKLKFQVLFENKLAAIFITQPDGSILDANRTAEIMFGYSVDEFRELGRDGVIDSDTPGLSEKLQERDDNGVASGELIGIRKGGDRFNCEFSSSIYIDESGERYTSTFLIDITDRKAAELSFEKAREEKIEILERIGDGFFAVDKDFKVTYWNHRATELLQMPKDKILDKHLWDLFSDAKNGISYQKYKKSLDEQRTIHFEDYYEGVKRWFDVSVYPSRNGLSVFFKDITQRKAYEELLTELNQSLEQKAKELASSNVDLENFAFVASHDLQEPLRMISSFLTQLETRYDHVLDEKGKKYIYYASDGAERMRRIILDLLEYSKVGRVGIERTHVDLNEVINDVTLLYKKLIKEKKALIKYEELPKIWAVKSSAHQILQNLIHNALNYCRADENSVITITSEESEDYWKISVRDNGIGIHPDNQEKIFNLFQRLHNNETYRGTGLGLAISKKIIEDHGGQIWLDSEEGEGSIFHFTIKKRGK